MCSCLFALLWMAAQFGQGNTGELRLTVTDPAGLPVQSAVELVSDANQLRQSLETDPEGTLVAKRLPFGRYRVEVSRTGFTTSAGLVDLQSVLPTEYHVTLSLAPLQAQVTVAPDATLLDQHRTNTLNQIGADTLQHRMTALPGRSLPDVVNTQPGWLLEANGILHPRGSEYQVQYVVDGLPITDNRSPSFAPEIEADDVHSMSILTGGYPAEYGRKLGGVIEVVTAGDARQGFHGSLVASGGSLGTASGYAMSQYGWGRSTLSVSANLAHSDRYLDPPVEENFTNSGTASNVAAHFERELTDADRLGVIVRHGRTSFLVPDERLQQDAGQRQDRNSQETVGQFSYQHMFSANVLGDVRGLVRDLSAWLSSNAFATPILARQDRGFRELYLKGTVAAHIGRHEWKAGVDADVGAIRESFGYQIADPGQFDPGTPPVFNFADRGHDREQALFVQDQMRLGAWTVNAGVRWDHYRLVVDENAVSPRLGIAWSWPAADLVIRASYDRAFQTPAVENLLLASSSALDTLNSNVVRLPVRPSLGNFYEAGFSKALFGKARLDVSQFRRDMRNFADDNLLLNTGVSFPIAFRRARIGGTEVKLELPHWRALSGFVSYANMLGVGYLPISGGLLVGEEAAASLTSTDRFPVTQDQRNTVRGRLACQVSSRAWVALAGSYGSGLPVEFAGDRQQAIAQYGQRIVDRVDLARGRVLPFASLDASTGVVLMKASNRAVRLQSDVLNLTGRLNVIDFAGLFSGTAIAPPRSVAVRLQAEF
jgi:TonB-dependent receptor-like protein/carboxypeptidase family protein